MCTGLELIALASTAAGTFINAQQQADYVKAVNAENQRVTAMAQAARAAEVARQQAMENEQAQVVQQGLEEIDPDAARKKVAEAAEDPDNQYVAQADAYNTETLPGQTSSGQISESIGKIVGDSLTRTRDILKSQSILAGQGAALQGNQDVLGRVGADIQTANSNRRRSANVAQMETNIPTANITPGDSILGDLLIMGGQLAGAGVFGGAGKAGAVTGGGSNFVSGFTPLAKPSAGTNWYGGVW